MFGKKKNTEIEENKEENKKWNHEEILKFLMENFEDEIREELFDDFEDFVSFRKNKMDISEKINFLLENFREDIEEELFDDFDDYVEFRRAIKNLEEPEVNYNKNSIENDTDEEDKKEIIGIKTFYCPECNEEFELEIDEDDDLEDGILTDCPECDEEVKVYEENLVENQEDEDRWQCEHCEEEFDLEDEQEDEIEKEGKIEVECPHCHKITNCEYGEI